MAQDKENRSKLRAREVREVNQTGHASVPSHLSQGENVETPIANKKDTSGLGNDNVVSPGFSQQHHAVTAQRSQHLATPRARFSNVSHPSPVNNLNMGTQHLVNLPHDNKHLVPNSFDNHNVHSHIAEGPHHHDHGEHNQRPIANPLDGYAFDPNVAGASQHYGAPNQVSHPSRHVSDPDSIRNLVGAPHYQQSAQPALHQPANPSQSANYGNLPMASRLNQQAANDFEGVAVQLYAYAEELQHMPLGSAQAQPAPQYDPNYFQGFPVQQNQPSPQPQAMGIVQGNGAARPDYIQGVSAQQHQPSQQLPPWGMEQDIPAAHQNTYPSVYPNNVLAAHSTGFQANAPQQHQLSQQPQAGMNMAQGILAAYPNNGSAAYQTGFQLVPPEQHHMQLPQQPQPMAMGQGTPSAHANNFQASHPNNLQAAHPIASQVVPAQQQQIPQQPQPMGMVQPIPVADPLDLGIPQDQPHPIIPGPPHPQANHPAVLALEDIGPDQDINEIIDAAASVLHADHRQCQHKWVDEDDVEHQCAGHA